MRSCATPRTRAGGQAAAGGGRQRREVPAVLGDARDGYRRGLHCLAFAFLLCDAQLSAIAEDLAPADSSAAHASAALRWPILTRSSYL